MYAIEYTTKTGHSNEDGKWLNDYTFTFGFNGRDEYLEQTAAWKARYKEVSKQIRQCKHQRKEANRDLKLDPYGYDNARTLGALREEARMLCQMRVQAKVEAGRQMMKQAEAA